MPSKGVELIHGSSLDAKALAEPTFLSACPNSNTFLIASSTQIAIVDQGRVVHSLATEGVCAASLHPSGNHILVASSCKLQLANVLVDGIRFFWEADEEGCSDAKFNRRGTVFAAVCGSSIVVFDFLAGQKLRSIDCDTTVSRLNWGQNCSLHAVCDEEKLLCKWDALDGAKLAEYSPEDGRIIAYTVSNEGKVMLATSANSIVTLNSDLKCTSAIHVDGEYVLSGSICVSNEGLVIVGMQQRGKPNSTLVRMYSAAGDECFDQPIEGSANVLGVAGRFLVTSNRLFEIKDGRGDSPYLTSCLDASIADEISAEETKETRLLASTSHVESVDASLSDLRSRITESEVMNEIRLRSLQQSQSEELRSLKESYDVKLAELEGRRARLLQEKQRIIANNSTQIKDTVSAQTAEVHQVEEKYKAEILSQVSENLRIEADHTKQVQEMESEKERLVQKQQGELAAFRMEAKQKLSKQRDTVAQLSKQRELVEHTCKEKILQFEDEIDNSISQLESRYQSEIKDERILSEKLNMEAGILRRRIASTRSTIDSCKERVSSLLHKEEAFGQLVLQKEDERHRLVEVKERKEAELIMKRDAVQKLMTTNHTLISTRDVDKDRLDSLAIELKDGPLTERNDLLRKEMSSVVDKIEEQNDTNEAMRERIAELKEVVTSEQQKVSRAERKMKNLNTAMDECLIKLEESNRAIQDPAKLKGIFSALQEMVSARQASKGQQQDDVPTDVDNQITLLFLQKLNELEELKAEDAAMTKQFKAEKAAQIAENATLLKKISSKAGGTSSRRRSSLFSGSLYINRRL